jgi:hypothetical protein
MATVEVGQIWIDKDSRMQGRRVIVTAVDLEHGWVRYAPATARNTAHPSFKYRAMLKRFPKAFRLETC